MRVRWVKEKVRAQVRKHIELHPFGQENIELVYISKRFGCTILIDLMLSS